MIRIGIAGAGFSGAVMARELADRLGASCLVFDPRPHVAGNCHTARDEETGVMVHQFGPHIFHTSNERVWTYVNRFASFGPFINRVKSKTQRGVFSLPINLHTINQFYEKHMSPSEALAWIRSQADASIAEPANFEEQALKFVGKEIYETFFYGYTKKQWGCEPRELPASVLKRLPVRFNYDDNYYHDCYQGIPREGYTALIEKILDHPRIELHLGQKLTRDSRKEFDHMIFTGPLDTYFEYQFGRLRYRTMVWERYSCEGDYQGVACMNFPDQSVPWTREVEHKHFTPWEQHEKTVWFREFSKPTGEDDTPFYPLRLAQDQSALAEYLQLAQNEKKVTFLGRLATYRYLDMHQVIEEALAKADEIIDSLR